TNDFSNFFSVRCVRGFWIIGRHWASLKPSYKLCYGFLNKMVCKITCHNATVLHVFLPANILTLYKLKVGIWIEQVCHFTCCYKMGLLGAFIIKAIESTYVNGMIFMSDQDQIKMINL